MGTWATKTNVGLLLHCTTGKGKLKVLSACFNLAFTSKVCPQASQVSESTNRACGNVALPTAETSRDVALQVIGTPVISTRCHWKATWHSGEVPGSWKRASIALVFKEGRGVSWELQAEKAMQQIHLDLQKANCA